MVLNRDKIDLTLARKQMSITTLAEVYGVSRTRMNVILNQRKVSTLTAGRLAAALGVDITEILQEGGR